jgi:hypothetical protein
MPTVYNDASRAGKQRLADKLIHDLDLIGRRIRELMARDRTNLTDDEAEDDLDDLHETLKAIEYVDRVSRRWQQKWISFESYAAAIHRRRRRLVPNEPAPVSVSTLN